MQLEALQDRLHIAEMQRLPAPAAIQPASPPAPALAGAAAADEELELLRQQLAQAQQQNSTLRATAARLGNALAAVMQRSVGGGSGGARGVPDGAAAASAVLAQLSAVENILSGMR